MISYFPHGNLRGTTENSINTGFFGPQYCTVVPQFKGRLGILNWYSLLGQKLYDLQQDLTHFISNCDHVVVVSTEEFWPSHPHSQSVASWILSELSDYSIIYHCNNHERINQLGVAHTWQPMFCRLACTDYSYLPSESDYDFACLLGRRKPVRNRLSELLSEYNCLINYAGRDNTQLDHDLSHYYTQNYGDTPITYTDQGSSLYVPGDTLDMAFLPPVGVYDQCHMDLISETFPRYEENTDTVVLSEKTARSLAHGRLFRTLGHGNYLGELIRCGFEPYPIWRSNHDSGTHEDCLDSFVADINEYSGNDFEMLYDECASEIAHNKRIYDYLISNYPNIIHKHFELIK